MPKKSLGELYADHLGELRSRADKALVAGGYDGLITCSGGQLYYYLDDSTYPFRPNPRYRAWLPDATPDCFVIYRPGSRPKLVFHQPDDYWYLPPASPEGYWVAHFDLVVVRSPAELRKEVGPGRWAILGEPGAATEGLGDHDPPAVAGSLDYDRAVKTAYEVECMALATAAGVRAHRTAEKAFRAGASEYEIHLAYCKAAGAREEERRVSCHDRTAPTPSSSTRHAAASARRPSAIGTMSLSRRPRSRCRGRCSPTFYR